MSASLPLKRARSSRPASRGATSASTTCSSGSRRTGATTTRPGCARSTTTPRPPTTDQKRRSGEPYLTHPLAVAWLLADLGFDATCVAIGLLHDVLEDTGATREDLADGVRRGGRRAGRRRHQDRPHEYVRRDQAQAETFRKLILASAKRPARDPGQARRPAAQHADARATCRPRRGAASRRRRSRSTHRSRTGSACRGSRASSRTSPSTTSIRTSSPSSSQARGEGQAGRGIDAQDQRAARRRARERRHRRRDQLAGQALLLDLPEAAAPRHRASQQLYDYLAFRIVTGDRARHLRRARRRSTRPGVRSRAGSRTTSRCRSRTSTSRSTPPWCGTRGSRSRSRSAPARWT